MNKTQRILWFAVTALTLCASANLHAYSFCGGDPVNHFDPDGRCVRGAFAGWNSAPVPGNASSAFMAGYYGGGIAGGFNEGWQGGEQIVANTFTFGGTDALGLTDTSQLQGADYTGSRILATVGRESLITAGTLGAAQLARGGSEAALYGYQGLMAANVGRAGYQVGTGIDQVANGNNWGYLQIAGGGLGLAGGFATAALSPELNTIGGVASYSGPVPPVIPAPGQVVYGALDDLGRPTGAYGTIDQGMLGTGTRADQSIIPPGFQGGAAGQARGHLLGAQLGGSGDDARNLVTILQNPANTPVMRGFENAAAAAVRGGQVLNYSAVPIYQGANAVPSGITIMSSGSGGFYQAVTVLNPIH